MPITIEKAQTVFDETQVKKGDLIRAKYETWEEPVNGIIAKVSEAEIRVFYIPAEGSTSNYFFIIASEVVAGKWLITWSTDMETIKSEGDFNDNA